MRERRSRRQQEREKRGKRDSLLVEQERRGTPALLSLRGCNSHISPFRSAQRRRREVRNGRPTKGLLTASKVSRHLAHMPPELRDDPPASQGFHKKDNARRLSIAPSRSAWQPTALRLPRLRFPSWPIGDDDDRAGAVPLAVSADSRSSRQASEDGRNEVERWKRDERMRACLSCGRVTARSSEEVSRRSRDESTRG